MAAARSLSTGSETPTSAPPFGAGFTMAPRKNRSMKLSEWPWVYRTILMPEKVPIAAPRATSLAQWALLYILDRPTSVAAPYIVGATIQVWCGHQRCDSLVTVDASANASVVCPDGND